MAAKDQQVIPMIAYEDGAAALDWLAAAFGFHERTRMTGKDGRISHAEMEAGDGLIMLARKWSSVPWVIDGVLVYIEDVVAHHERAKKAGATILSEPESDAHGLRYRAEDIEGHRWMFMERR